MHYFDKLLVIFCICLMLTVINGELPADSPSEDCEPIKAKYLNDQIRQKLKEYPDVDFPKLELEETFKKLRGDLISAMIRKPKPDHACENARQALDNFQQFMLQYENIKGMLENLMKKLTKVEEFSYLSDEEKFEAYRLSLTLEASPDIDTAKQNIKSTKMFLRELSPAPKSSLLELLRHVIEALDNMNNQTALATNATEVQEVPENPVQNLLLTLAENLSTMLHKPLPSKETSFNGLLNIVAKNLDDILKNPSLYQNDIILKQSVNRLAESIAKIINQETGGNQMNLIESLNNRINHLLRSHPKKEITSIKLNQIFNEKRRHLIDVILPLDARPGAMDLAEQAINDFMDFVEKYKSISHRIEWAVEKLARFEANPTYTMQTKYQALKCKTELENSATIDEGRKALKNCINYSEPSTEAPVQTEIVPMLNL